MRTASLEMKARAEWVLQISLYACILMLIVASVTSLTLGPVYGYAALLMWGCYIVGLVGTLLGCFFEVPDYNRMALKYKKKHGVTFEEDMERLFSSHKDMGEM